MAEIERVSVTNLREFVSSCLEARGVPTQDASVAADVLLTANLCGIESHGIVRLPHYVRRLENGTIVADPVIEIERTSPTSAIVDGGNGLGHVVAFRATEMLAELTASSGTASVVVRNSSHFGIAGYYVRRLIEHGFCAMAMTPSDALLVPFGGTKPFFGTNPVAMGFPPPIIDGIELAPVVLDMATTSIPYGKIIVAQQEGHPIPSDWGLDSEGNPTTDAERIVGLHPVAGPKGSGLAMMIDLFTSLLAGMPFGPHIHGMYREMDRPRKLAHFFTAWDLARFRPVEEFAQDLGRMVTELREIPPKDGFDRVCYPGEIEGERMEDRSAQGIPITPELKHELVELAHKLRVSHPFG